MRFILASSLLFAAHLACAGEPAAINPKSLAPGLNAVYRSLIDDSTLSRVDAKPALALGDSSPHPRIPPGPFSASWSGIIQLRGDGPFTFDAFVSGELTITIDNAVVLKGRGETDTAQIRSAEPFKRAAGRYRILIEYKSLPKIPARLQIWWEGAGFVHEPLPPWLLKHSPEELPDSAKQDDLAEAGRAAVGRLGCAQCHTDAFPGVHDPQPGPSLTGIGARVSREWLLSFLDDPSKAHAAPRMPALFKADRDGLIERWILADFLLKDSAKEKPANAPAPGDHRQGKKDFQLIGCVACHFVPDMKMDEQKELDRSGFESLGDRLPSPHLAEFLMNPSARFPDGRHPHLPVKLAMAQHLSAYLLLWSKPTSPAPPDQPVTAAEIEQAAKRLGMASADEAAKSLLRSKGCTSCHAGLGDAQALKVPLPMEKSGGCLAGTGNVRFKLDAPTREAIAAYRAVAAREKYPSSVDERRRLVARVGCFRCHSASDRQPPLEEASATLGGSNLEAVPFLRTPRLINVCSKYKRDYLLSAIRDSVSGIRFKRFSFLMPKFGEHAEQLVQALAEMDGDLAVEATPPRPPSDPTLNGPGATLVGFEGYSCVSCHTWNGKQLNEGDPGAIGPDLTTVARRIRPDWFSRWMNEPGRIVPGTVMPQIFTKGQPATIKTVLDADAARQKEAIWAYLSLGPDAPSPKPLPSVPVDFPAANLNPMVAQIPIRCEGASVESICIAYGSHDLLVYDVGALKPRSIYTGAQILRAVKGRTRTFTAAGALLADFNAPPAASLLEPAPQSVELLGYDRLNSGARIRLRAKFEGKTQDGSDSFLLLERKLIREIKWTGTPAKTYIINLPPEVTPPEMAKIQMPPDPDNGGSLVRPGYRAIAYPRPKTPTGDDLLMPGAVAVHPEDGRVFIASMKNGELFVLNDPNGDGTKACFENYGGGLFQEAYSMLCEKDGLYVLHRRNLTKITEAHGTAAHFDRVFALPHAIIDAYDYGYGLVRDKTGAFVFSFAQYGSNRKMPGAGGAVRMVPGKEPEEIAYGFRNPLGWCSGPDGEIFYTDNQGEWVATNKMCHIVKGRYYGYPNPEQKEHTTKPFGKTALWVPYSWARSINGVTYNNTGEKFGPFGGQFFLAELMYGGAIIRANMEKVNGEYQGACFPFWGKGLLGPLTLAFDPNGRLFVGSITEPGWMAQPDRGALFRIDFTGETPFEIHSINVLPRGFRLNFTLPVDAKTAAAVAAYSIEHYRYEYTGAYGSPELDRTPLPIEKLELAPDGKSVELQTGALTKERVYMISAAGVKSKKGQALDNPTGAYTLNEIPEPAK